MNPNLFKGEYRIESTRLQEWDYSWDGYYHVIIFVKDREKFPLGKIIGGKMCLSNEGKIVRENLINSINNYSNCELDTFAIMSNHVHGLIKIGRGITEFPMDIACNKRVEPIHKIGVETIHESSLRGKKTLPRNLRRYESSLQNSRNSCLSDKNTRRKMLLFKVVGRFKMRSAKLINLYRNTPGESFWQSRFYDRIIRDEKHLNQAREYVNKNVIEEWWKINNLDVN
ncbi:transposase [Patescibacteria group bacterium]